MHLPIPLLRTLKEFYPATYQFALNHMAKYHETAYAKGIPLTHESDAHVKIINKLFDRTLRKVYRGKRDSRDQQAYCLRKNATSYALYDHNRKPYIPLLINPV